MIVCPACGRPTEPGWTTCLNCGKALRQAGVKPGDVLPPREQPVQQQPQVQYQQQYQQQPYQPPQYQPPRKSCFGRFVLWLFLAALIWYLVTHFIPAMADIHTLFDSDYTTPQEVGAWLSRLIPWS